MFTEIGLKIILRFFFGGGAVAVSALVGKSVGGKVGGIFAAFPAVYLSAVIAVGASTAKATATSATLEVSKGALVGMFANIFCAIVAAKTIPKYGWKKGLTLAIVIWLCLAVIIYLAAFRFGWMG